MAKLITFVDNQGRYRTVAPAYNKGAYQVIGEEYIKDIGR